MRTKRLPANLNQRLQDQAKKKIDRIFRYLPCVVCLSFGKENNQTVPHHLLSKANYGSKRHIIWNLLPLCSTHHTMGTEIVTEAAGGDTQVIRNFEAWLKNTLPLHYKWYIENREDRAPHKLTLSERGQIYDDLKYLEDHRIQAEELIYESYT